MCLADAHEVSNIFCRYPVRTDLLNPEVGQYTASVSTSEFTDGMISELGSLLPDILLMATLVH